jgi:hypothetical protein
MQQLASLPVVGFDDDLGIRARQARFRGVGNPQEFLTSIGIIPIKEFLFRGANLIDVADTLNVPLTAIHIWVEENHLKDELAAASKISAEGYIHRGESLLAKAKDKFSLDKAKAMLEHGRFMASKKDKMQYGTTQEIGTGNNAGVTYIFNMGSPQEIKAVETIEVKPAIDAEFKEVEPFSLEMDFTAVLQEVPAHVRDAMSAVPKETIREVDQWIT